jgi:hypothetical protein
MLVLSRTTNQSVVIQNRWLLTVSEIHPTWIRITVAEKIRGGRISFADSVESILNSGDIPPLLNGASVSFRNVRDSKAILEFHGLAGEEVDRKEVYDMRNGISDI